MPNTRESTGTRIRVEQMSDPQPKKESWMRPWRQLTRRTKTVEVARMRMEKEEPMKIGWVAP
jgi:hypothetical protein